MATVKVKLRPSTVPGKAGTIYYQLTHLRQVKQITTKIHLHPQDWDSNKAQIIFTDSTSYLYVNHFLVLMQFTCLSYRNAL